MIDLTIFPDCRNLAKLQQELLAEIEVDGRGVLRYLRGNKSKDGKFALHLLPQAQEHLSKIEAADARLVELEEDAEEFGTMLGNYPNVRMLAELLNKERDKINRTAMDARVVYELALKTDRRRRKTRHLWLEFFLSRSHCPPFLKVHR
jgi:hypothetical protein